MTKIIHIASYRPEGEKGRRYLFLQEEKPGFFRWYSQDGSRSFDVAADNIEEAIRLAGRYWGNENFKTLACGFRYTLPERDEHGMNALFYHLDASCNGVNGVYFDEELGHNCFVQNASSEALQLRRRLMSSANKETPLI